MPKFRPDLSARSKNIAEKEVPGKLKPIVGYLRPQITVEESQTLRTFCLFTVVETLCDLRQSRSVRHSEAPASLSQTLNERL